MGLPVPYDRVLTQPMVTQPGIYTPPIAGFEQYAFPDIGISIVQEVVKETYKSVLRTFAYNLLSMNGWNNAAMGELSEFTRNYISLRLRKQTNENPHTVFGAAIHESVILFTSNLFILYPEVAQVLGQKASADSQKNAGIYTRLKNEMSQSYPPGYPHQQQPMQYPPGYQQPGYPPGYPQPGYPTPGYPQPAYPQPGYPQQQQPMQYPPGYQQPGYPPAQYPQPGYPQPNYPQPGYPQPNNMPIQNTSSRRFNQGPATTVVPETKPVQPQAPEPAVKLKNTIKDPLGVGLMDREDHKTMWFYANMVDRRKSVDIDADRYSFSVRSVKNGTANLAPNDYPVEKYTYPRRVYDFSLESVFQSLDIFRSISKTSIAFGQAIIVEPVPYNASVDSIVDIMRETTRLSSVCSILSKYTDKQEVDFVRDVANRLKKAVVKFMRADLEIKLVIDDIVNDAGDISDLMVSKGELYYLAYHKFEKELIKRMFTRVPDQTREDTIDVTEFENTDMTLDRVHLWNTSYSIVVIDSYDEDLGLVNIGNQSMVVEELHPLIYSFAKQLIDLEIDGAQSDVALIHTRSGSNFVVHKSYVNEEEIVIEPF